MACNAAFQADPSFTPEIGANRKWLKSVHKNSAASLQRPIETMHASEVLGSVTYNGCVGLDRLDTLFRLERSFGVKLF
jgi:hypothetical protein